MRDIGSIVTLKRLVAEAVATTSPASVVIDRGSANGNLYDGLAYGFFVGVGGITFTASNYIALRLEDSDDNVTFANVAAGATVLSPTSAVVGQAPDANGFVRFIAAAKAAADPDPFKVSYIGNRRYVRSTAVFGGTHSTGTLVGLWAVLGYPGSMPPA